ncbi:DUF4331 family protein [Streptomyces cyaneofuscatus]|uniref:DUF4331 family protein n=1 Tax=Streptomyces cyaneofuscatus TaxID=66883 RepID=UPI003657859C
MTLALGLSAASSAVRLSPHRRGSAGELARFPNGRHLADDVIDISLQAVEGAALSGVLVPALVDGDKVDTNEVPFGTSFPYVALPHTKNVNRDPGAAGRNTEQSSAENTVASPAMQPTHEAALARADALLLGVGGFHLRLRGKDS